MSPPLIAQVADDILPDGGLETAIWVLIAAVIVGLYLIVRRTRKKTMNHYLDREQREQEMKERDPDLRKDEPDGDA